MRVSVIRRILRMLLGVVLWGGFLLGEGSSLRPAYKAQAAPVLQVAEPGVILPPNFQMRSVVSGLHLPTDMVLLPSGDLLVAGKGQGMGTAGVAEIWLIRRGVLLQDPVLTLSVTVVGDSGIYSLILDPAFAANHYFYVWYSLGAAGMEWPGKSVDRLSRFTFDPQTGKADALSETIILNDIRWSQYHNGGGLAFDDDGNLFIATGDAAIDGLAQDMTSLNGKLLRIRPLDDGGYNVPTENGDLWTQTQGGEDAPTQLVRPEIYASGLRNPFRMAWQTERSTGVKTLYLIDLGFGSWEEIDRVEAGANYGWAVREGPCPKNVRDVNCPPAPPQYTDPVVSYPHPPEGGAGITALAFYEGDTWPAIYKDKLFFADFNSHELFMVDLNDPQNIISFGDEVGHLVDIEATPDGLYLLSIYDGSIHFLYYSELGNQWPTAQLSATPVQGVAPLMVNFSAEGSSDPENDALSYVWDFGDGTVPVTSTQVMTTHLYAVDGDYTATLQVVDALGGRSAQLTTPVQVYSGAMPTIVREIVGDAERTRYRGGDAVRFSLVREGGEAGLDATTPYLWSIKQHHNQHIHFVVTEAAGSEVVLEIANDSHAAEVNIWYEAELLMRTASGQVVRVTNNLLPDVVALDVVSLPSGASMLWNGVQQPANQDIAAIVGQKFVLEAPEILYYGRTKNAFVAWHIWEEGAGGDEVITERSFELLVTSQANSYVAHYDFIASSHVLFLPTVMDVVADSAQ